MTSEILLLFTLTTALACFTPGPAAMLTASVGTSRSVRLVAHSIAGIAIANVLYFVLSAAGIASLISESPRIYALIRWLGAFYLIYLGVRLVFESGGLPLKETQTNDDTVSSGRVFAKGFVVEFSNPKALLYFSALLPQFVTPSLPLAPQFVTFSLITVLLDLLAYSFYGSIGFGVARLSAPSLLGAIRRVAGIAFVLAGARLAWAG
jgi:homoserine/homoserine lactone efflux protein